LISVCFCFCNNSSIGGSGGFLWGGDFRGCCYFCIVDSFSIWFLGRMGCL
jgi:hypothetical protein